MCTLYKPLGYFDILNTSSKKMFWLALTPIPPAQTISQLQLKINILEERIDEATQREVFRQQQDLVNAQMLLNQREHEQQQQLQLQQHQHQMEQEQRQRDNEAMVKDKKEKVEERDQEELHKHQSPSKRLIQRVGIEIDLK